LWSVLELVRHPVLYNELPPLFNVQVAIVFVLCMTALAIVCLKKLERTLVFWV
jgi:ABC-type polysaccharide/polyol phosphate export permease